jgi:hypothetical protein
LPFCLRSLRRGRQKGRRGGQREGERVKRGRRRREEESWLVPSQSRSRRWKDDRQGNQGSTLPEWTPHPQILKSEKQG